MIKHIGIIGIIIFFIDASVVPITTCTNHIPTVLMSHCSGLDFTNNEFQNQTISFDFIDSNTDHSEIKNGNLPPYTPKNPYPQDNATSVPINSDLRWTGGDPDVEDNVTYDVYFGDTLPLQKIGHNISTNSYDLGILAEYTLYMWSIIAWDNQNLFTQGPTWRFTTSNTTNNPPFKPNQPTGETNGIRDYEYPYSTITYDPDGDQILYYLWDWGDGNYSEWLGPYNSKVRCEENHSWTVKGNYTIKVKAKDLYDFESDWSNPLPITMPYINKNPLQLFFGLLFEQVQNRGSSFCYFRLF